MPMFRRACASVVAVVVLFGTFLSAGAAHAQTPPPTYSPGTSVPPHCNTGPVDAGTLTSGHTVAISLGGPFTPGDPVNIKVNGEPDGTKVSADGCVPLAISPLSCTSAEVNGTTVGVMAGTNTVTASGASANGGTATQTATFNLECSPTNSGVLALALTGTNVIKVTLAALLLIVLGGGLVLFQRRRRSRTAS